MARDLPIEIWREILSYPGLPGGTASKLIGVSRNLYEIGMIEKYETVYVGSPVHFLAKSYDRKLEQLKFKCVSSRVRKATISASFSAFTSKGSSTQQAQGPWASLTTWKSPSSVPIEKVHEIHTNRNLSTLALQGLKECKSLEEVTLEAQGYDSITAPACACFLAELFDPVFSAQIKVLELNLSLSKWTGGTHPSSFMQDTSPFTTQTYTTLPIGRLESLSKVTLSLTLPDPTTAASGDEYKSFATEFKELLISVRASLKELFIILARPNARSACTFDLAEILSGMSPEGGAGEGSSNGIVVFPCLQEITIDSEVIALDSTRAYAVALFLAKCATNVESLTLSHGAMFYNPAFMGLYSSNPDEPKRLNLGATLRAFGAIGTPLTSLKKLVIPMPILEIEPLVSILRAGLLPGLQKLALAPLSPKGGLSFDSFKAIMDGIVQGGGANELVDILFHVASLSPSHLQIVQDSLPKVRKLVIGYGFLTNSPDVQDERDGEAISAAFKALAHPEWKYRELQFEQTEFDTIFIEPDLKGLLRMEQTSLHCRPPLAVPSQSLLYSGPPLGFPYDSDDDYFQSWIEPD